MQNLQDSEIPKPKSSRKKTIDQWSIKPTENSNTSKNSSPILQPIVVVRNRRKTMHFHNNTSSERNMLTRTKSQPVNFNTLLEITKVQKRQQIKAITSNENCLKDATSLNSRKYPFKKQSLEEKINEDLESAYLALKQMMRKVEKLQAKREKIEEKNKAKLDKKKVQRSISVMSKRHQQRSDAPLMPKLTPMPRNYKQPAPLFVKSKIHIISDVELSDSTRSFVENNGKTTNKLHCQTCYCSSTSEDIYGVFCDTCSSWHHFKCITVDDQVGNGKWHCKICLERKKSSNPESIDDDVIFVSYSKPERCDVALIAENLQIKMEFSTVCKGNITSYKYLKITKFTFMFFFFLIVCKGTFDSYKIYNEHSLNHE